MTDVSSISAIAISYCLLTVGTNVDESPIMRTRCADAARELGYTDTARQIEESLASVRV